MKKRILIVDDDRSIRSSLRKILAESGYEVADAPDGDSAQGKFSETDLLILDLNLPIQDGQEKFCLSHIRRRKQDVGFNVLHGLPSLSIHRFCIQY